MGNIGPTEDAAAAASANVVALPPARRAADAAIAECEHRLADAVVSHPDHCASNPSLFDDLLRVRRHYLARASQLRIAIKQLYPVAWAEWERERARRYSARRSDDVVL